MKCPKCKKNLQTKRTTAGTDKVSRERYCAKCKTPLKTIELFKMDFDKMIHDAESETMTAKGQAEYAQNKYSTLKEAIKTIIKSAEEK